MLSVGNPISGTLQRRAYPEESPCMARELILRGAKELNGDLRSFVLEIDERPLPYIAAVSCIQIHPSQFPPELRQLGCGDPAMKDLLPLQALDVFLSLHLHSLSERVPPSEVDRHQDRRHN